MVNTRSQSRAGSKYLDLVRWAQQVRSAQNALYRNAGTQNLTWDVLFLIAEAQYGEILGVHIIGPHATDLISEGCAILGLEGTAEDLAHVIHPHPTLGEGMMEAAHGLIGSPIHM